MAIEISQRLSTWNSVVSAFRYNIEKKEPAMRKYEHLFQVENKRHILSNKTDVLRTIWNSLNRGNSSRLNLKISHGYIINDDNSDGI